MRVSLSQSHSYYCTNSRYLIASSNNRLFIRTDNKTALVSIDKDANLNKRRSKMLGLVVAAEELGSERANKTNNNAQVKSLADHWATGGLRYWHLSANWWPPTRARQLPVQLTG